VKPRERSRSATAVAAQPADRVPVLLIACAGRSGSTLLDRILGTRDGLCSTGELRFIWERSFAGNELCGCGVPFHDCQFWSAVSRRVFGVRPRDVDAGMAIHLRRALDEMRRTPWLAQPVRPAGVRRDLRDYGELLERLYSGIQEASQARVIVDSSGDASHGLILAGLPRIELHVVHLVRDARAVAFSATRLRRRPEVHWAAQNMPVEPAWASARWWLEQNAAAELLRRRASSYTRVRYEDLVRTPDAVLDRAIAPLGFPVEASPWTEHGRVVLSPSHTVAGNPMRFKTGPLQISLDDEWRTAMVRRNRRTVTAMTWPLLLRYGYRLA